MKKLIIPMIVILTLVAFYLLDTLNVALNPTRIVSSEPQLKNRIAAGSPSKEPEYLQLNKSTEDLLAITVNCRSQMVSITPFMYPVGPGFDIVCRGPIDPNELRGHRETFVSGQNVWISMYLSKNAIEGFRNGEQQFPAGTVVIKEKLWKDPLDNVKKANQLPDRVVLYTGMLKREKGFNPECGDWEFFTVSGDGKTLNSRGKLVSCMNCHKNYAKSDYVVSQYSEPPELPRKNKHEN